MTSKPSRKAQMGLLVGAARALGTKPCRKFAISRRQEGNDSINLPTDASILPGPSVGGELFITGYEACRAE